MNPGPKLIRIQIPKDHRTFSLHSHDTRDCGFIFSLCWILTNFSHRNVNSRGWWISTVPGCHPLLRRWSCPGADGGSPRPTRPSTVGASASRSSKNLLKSVGTQLVSTKDGYIEAFDRQCGVHPSDSRPLSTCASEVCYLSANLDTVTENFGGDCSGCRLRLFSWFSS